MLSMDQVASSLQLMLALWVFLGLFWLYRDYQIDRLREHLFSLRDELFDSAHENDLLNEKGYVKLRLIMNSMIQFSHKITFVRFALSVLMISKLPKEEMTQPFTEWLEIIDKLPLETRNILIEYHAKMAFLIFQSMINRSILLSTFRLIYASNTKLRKIVGQLARNSQGMQLLEAQALRSKQ